MLPGPDHILACPHCDAVFRRHTLLSGNTFGSETWTDGLFVAPMLPSGAALGVCAGCEEFIWVADAPFVGEVDEWMSKDDPVPWRAARELRDPSLDEYYDYIAHVDEGVVSLSSDRERTLRLLTWRADNDQRRTTRVYPPPLPAKPPSSRFYRNLEQLSRMLSDDEPEQRLLRAEILRERRRFGEALAILNTEFPEDMSQFASALRSLAQSGDAVVRRV